MRDEQTLGPFTPDEVVGELRAESLVDSDAAWLEGEANWYRVIDILRYAGLTPSGRPLSKKLRRPLVDIDPIPHPPDAVIDGVPVVQPAAGPVPLIEKHGWDDAALNGFDWTIIRKLGMAAPVLVLLTMKLPWFSLAGEYSVSGFRLFTALSVPGVMLFFLFVFGVGYYANQASMGDDLAASGATFCALLAILPLGVAVYFMDVTVIEKASGMRLGGGLDMCIGVLIITSGLACVPLRWEPETSVRMFFSVATVCLGLYFVAKGVVFLVEHFF